MGILAGCREADRPDEAARNVASAKPLEVVEAELAWVIGRVY